MKNKKNNSLISEINKDDLLIMKITVLDDYVERKLPEFAKSIRETNSDVVIMHQDSFAADMQADEYLLLGMAIKFAGIYGKEIRIIGTIRETIK